MRAIESSVELLIARARLEAGRESELPPAR
jgi:hypothetical protein